MPPSSRAARGWARVMTVAVLAAGLVGLGRPGPARADEVYPVPSDGVFQLTGHGWGHGHGMSQWGAEGGAEQGATAAQITSFYYPGTTLGTIPDAPIRVLLQGTDGVQVAVAPAAGLVATDLGTGASRPLSGAPGYRAVVDSAGLHLQQRSGSQWQTLTVGGRASLAGPLQFSTTGTALVGLVYPDGSTRDYRGALLAVPWQGELIAVDRLPMEQYLLGVVPRESPSSFLPAALQAQAIAARSYAAFEAAHAPAGQPWDICDTTACQVFGGTTLVLPDGSSYPLEASSTTQAVQATAGEVRLYGGQPIFAQFSSSDGGWTVAGGEPYLVAQADPWDGVPGEDVHTWTAQLPASAVEAAFAGQGLGRLVDIRVTSRDGHGDWGGRVQTVVLDGVDASGQPTQVTTTGADLAAVYGWPEHAAGLRSDWWTVDSSLDATLVSQSGPASTVAAPGPAAVQLRATLRNTGSADWPVDGLTLVGSAGSVAARTTGTVAQNLTRPGATSVAPGDTAEVAATVALPGLPPGGHAVTLRLSAGGGAPFGPALTWSVQVLAPVLSATPVSPPPVLAVPATGSTQVHLVFRNTGNVAWPSGGMVRLATAAPRDRASAVAGPGWLSANRVAAVVALPPAPGAPSPAAVPPGGLAAVTVPLAGHGAALGPRAAEGFDLVWDGVAWFPAPISLPVVVIDPAQARSAVLSARAATPALVGDPLGRGLVRIDLVNTGAGSWPVGREPLTLTGAGPLAPAWVPLAADLTSPGSAAVAPGEVGEWLVPLTGGGPPGTVRLVARAGPAGAPYGPAVTVQEQVLPVGLGLTLLPPDQPVVIPRHGSVTFSLQVRNTGSAALPLRDLLRLTVPAGTPFAAPGWPAPDRIGTLAVNLSAPTAVVLGPGQVGLVRAVLDGNGAPPGTGTLALGAVWDGFALVPLADAALPYRVS